MNIRDLKYLIAVAELKHFGHAADSCFVSQPTLSSQLKKLEDELGVTLFERTNKSVLVTDIGIRIVDQATTVLREIDQIYALANQSKDPLAGRFELGIIPTLGPYLLPYIIPEIKKQLPNLELHIHEDKTDTVLDALKRGQLDAIISALPLEDHGCEIKELFQEPFYVAMVKDHKLASKSKVTISDIEDETLLLLADGHCLRDQALDVCKNVNIKREKGLQAASLETLRHIIATGVGVTLLPKIALTSDYKKNTDVIYKAFVDPAPFRKVGLVWRQLHARAICCEKIGQIIADIMPQYL